MCTGIAEEMQLYEQIVSLSYRQKIIYFSFYKNTVILGPDRTSDSVLNVSVAYV
jgi:hypothetical protein